jgi:alkylated DNA repair dioxygenase AlkB
MFREVSLFGVAEPAFDPELPAVTRVALDARSWVDHAPGWLSGADSLFDEVLAAVTFTQRRGIPMYDDLVDEPRLTAWWHADGGAPEPVEVLADIRRALAERYARPFDSIGFNLYRDGADSVAWHGDRHRHRVTDPVVAILSVGAPRPLRLRPRGGGASRAWSLGDGDLFVMGGSCQHDWEHCVPKVRRAVGPRLSITFRHETR